MKLKQYTYYKLKCPNGGYDIYYTDKRDVLEVAMSETNKENLCIFTQRSRFCTIKMFQHLIDLTPGNTTELTDNEAFLELL